MTVSSGFFNSVNHDRLYDAEQLSSIFDGILIDGVYENYGDAFMITANSEANSSVLVGTGRAWFDHTWTLNDSIYALQLDPPNEMLGRIDAIVIDVDRTTDTRKNSIMYLKGSESTPNQPPTLVNEERHNQYLLATITRDAGEDAPISQSKINYVVGTSTPIVTSVLEAQNLDNMWQQLNAEFQEWWDNVKATLDENTVTNLQNQIDEIKEQINGEDALVGLLEKPIAEAFMSGDYHIAFKNTTLPSAYGFFPYVTFLPDGKILTIGVSGASLTVNLVTSNGVNTPTTHSQRGVNYSDLPSDCSYILDASELNYGSIRYSQDAIRWSILDMQYDTYPITIYAVSVTHHAVEGSFNNSTDMHSIAMSTIITISSTGVVSFVDGDPQFDNKIHWSSSIGHGTNASSPGLTITNYRVTMHCDPNSSGEWIVGYSSCSASPNFDWIKGLGLDFWKVSKNGIVSSGVVSDNINEAHQGTVGTAIIMKAESMSDNFYYYPVSNINNSTSISYRISVNSDSLKASLISETRNEEPLSSYITRSSAYLYELGEDTGLVKTGLDSGVKNTLIGSNKISNYFVGASNSGDNIPEGSYYAYESDGLYYGICATLHYVAVGSNGGAAILKKKASGAPSISIEDVALWNNGSKFDNDAVYYIVGSPQTSMNNVSFKLFSFGKDG